MDPLILTCLQAQLLVGRVNAQDISKQQKNDLVWELKQISPKECKIDAPVELKERTNTHKVKEQTNGPSSNQTKNVKRDET
jgi:hypothetical protein